MAWNRVGYLRIETSYAIPLQPAKLSNYVQMSKRFSLGFFPHHYYADPNKILSRIDFQAQAKLTQAQENENIPRMTGEEARRYAIYIDRVINGGRILE